MRGIAAFAAVFLAGGAWAADVEPAQQQNRRIHEAGSVLSEIMDAKDRSIPRDLIQKSYCVGIVPSMKRAGFIVGAKYGKGVIVCRQDNSVGWSAPSSIRVEGGNIGLQIGLGETDLIFVVMNRKGQNGLMRDRFTIGVDASAMGGPLGRDRGANRRDDASRDSGVFAVARNFRGDCAGRGHAAAGRRGQRQAVRTSGEPGGDSAREDCAASERGAAVQGAEHVRSGADGEVARRPRYSGGERLPTAESGSTRVKRSSRRRPA